CPSTSNQLPGMLHHHEQGPWRDVRGPAAVVLVPGGDGALYRAEVISAERCCAANIRAAVTGKLAAWEGAAARPFARARPSSGNPSAGRWQAATPSEAFSHVRGWAASRDGTCAS